MIFFGVDDYCARFYSEIMSDEYKKNAAFFGFIMVSTKKKMSMWSFFDPTQDKWMPNVIRGKKSSGPMKFSEIV